MTFGLSESGFLPKDLATCKAELEAKWREKFGANVEVEPESPDGQIIGILAEREATMWEQAERVYSSQYLDGAEDASLDDLVALADKTRNPATKSRVTLALTGTAGALIPAGSISEESESGRLWVHLEDVTLDGTGAGSVLTEAAETGPIAALAGTIDAINTPVLGWAGVVNPLDAVLGRNVEVDAALRNRYRTGFRAEGSSDEALFSALSALEGVTEVLVISNRSAFPVAGQPAKSVQCVVEGGADQDIRDTIWAVGPSGIEFFGSVPGTVTDSAGDVQDVAFSRLTDVLVYVLVQYVPEDGAPIAAELEASIQAEVLAHAATQRGGLDVIPFQYVQNIETAGLRSLRFNVGTSPAPSSDSILAIAKTEKAKLDSTRIHFEILT